MTISSSSSPFKRGPMLALVAAFLGWMFDGMEMGIFPIVARPALQAMQAAAHIADEGFVQRWMGIVTALFLFGAAGGGLVFGWLGDRVGRVRAMTWSILCYSLFTGLCYFASQPWHLGAFRFIAALGMGGEWALGVALVMESWPARLRPLMAGCIGAAANFGYALIAIIAIQFPVTTSSWRWVMMVGAAPALLTFFIRFFVPESERWQESVKARPSNPVREIFGPSLLKNTLLAIAFSSVALIVTWGIVQWIPLWADQMTSEQAKAGQGRVVEEVARLSAAAGNGSASLQQASAQAAEGLARLRLNDPRGALPRIDETITALRGAADRGEVSASLIREQETVRALVAKQPAVKGLIQLVSSIGAIVGCVVAPLVGGWFGRRPVYFGLCLASFIACSVLFRGFQHYSGAFLAMVGVVGFTSAAFYGWLPLYLPELFPTRARATGQGLAFNFGRILAAVGAWQMGSIMAWFDNSYAKAGAEIILVYLVGMMLIWFAPETKHRPLPE
ncbi:MAG TPA: MFS transporter [Verrucomicrobiae bacterium]|nr:MFS transporter [Verrucomicrobiae bacterium]